MENLQSELDQFVGTTDYYRYSTLFQYWVLTDGTRFLAERANAYWLMDAIASNCTHLDPRNYPFIVVKLKVKEGRSAVLTFDDGNGFVFKVQDLPYTDFPLPGIKLYVQPHTLYGWIIFLPSEY